MLHILKFESDHYIGNDPVHSPDPHCHSYFAATRNDAAEYAPLNGDTRTDVCVIGAGFTGLSAALLLAERGFSVTVLEQNRVGWGASGRCGGQMIGGVPGEDRLAAVAGPALADSLFDLGYLGHEIIARWVQKYRIDCDLNYGYIDVATKPRHLEKQKFWYDRLCARGSEKEVRLVPRGELSELIGTDRYIGGMLNWRSGHLHPLNLCLGEARAAAGRGVMIHEGSAVLAIEQGVRPEVHTSGGKVLADHVLLAGNAYHLLEQTTFSSLLFPASTFIVATEPLSEAEMSAINPQNIAVCDQSLVMDYFRLSTDRRLLFGGGCHYTGREPADLRQAMRRRIRAVYPSLADKRLDYAWSGQMAIVVKRVPLLGRLAPNVFYSQGYSGHGLSLSHACGDILCDAVQGNTARLEMFERVPPGRIPLGRKLGGYAMAAEMLYHRLRDRC